MTADSLNKKRLPPWFKVSFAGKKERGEVRHVLRDLKLNSVCEGAKCPNLCDCWHRKTATFMILGEHCTRNCAFCAVTHEKPQAVEDDEPERIAEAAARLNLNHVVITSVTRDDLPDGGADHFARTIKAVRNRLPKTSIEVLTPDFGGNLTCVDQVCAARPDVFNHNIETCRRLTSKLRDKANYECSLRVLKRAASQAGKTLMIKSGFMLGVGETDDEIKETLLDLKTAGVTSITVGQYLPPTEEHWPVDRFVTPAEFAEWQTYANKELGIQSAVCGPHIRSSYHAEEGLTGAK